MKKKVKYVTVSIPTGVVGDIDKLIEVFEYWPSRGAFVREACLEKIRSELKRLMEFKETAEGATQSLQGV